MIAEQDIRDFASRLVTEFRPHKVVLFGSHARGEATVESDVDLLVVMPFEGSALRKTVEILDRVNPQFPIDLLLRRPDDAEFRYRHHDSIVTEAFDHGKVLFEVAA